jgi:hypothetical protein
MWNRFVGDVQVSCPMVDNLLEHHKTTIGYDPSEEMSSRISSALE